MHRLTGVAMLFGLLLIICWFLAAAFNETVFLFIDYFLQSWMGIFIIFGSLWAFWFHFLNGIRHLFWDAGYGFNLETVARSGWTVVIGSILLTIVSLIAL